MHFRKGVRSVIAQGGKALGDPDLLHATKSFGLAMAVGVLTGLFAIGFHWLSEWVFHISLEHLAGYHPREIGSSASAVHRESTALVPWLLVVLPTIGGLLTGVLIQRLSPASAGHGTDSALAAYHHNAGYIPWHVPIVKLVTSAITLGTGGSGGREGPIAQIGAGIGSFLACRLKLSVKERRVLLAAGMGAGVGAIFRAPLAGAVFAAEIHYSDPEFESEAVIPGAIASICSYCVFSLVYGFDPLFDPGKFDFQSPAELLPYAILAFAVSAAGILFVRTFHGATEVFQRLQFPKVLKPALGGFLTGVVGMVLYYLLDTDDVLNVMAFGYGSVQGALDGKISAVILVVIATGKIVTTSLTIGSGGSGGVFGPSMVTGGAVGGAVGQWLHEAFPTLVRHPGAYVIVGMAGFFAGAANTPISTIIMVSEMTGHYALLLPSLWVCAICFFLMRKTHLYHQSKNHLESPAHRGDFHFDVLESLRVRDVVTLPRSEVITFSQTARLGEVLHRISETHQNYFPIVDKDDHIHGVFSLNDIRGFMYDEDVWEIAIAADFATTDVLRATPSDDLDTVLRRFTRKNIDELPIVSDDDPNKIVGLLRRNDCIDKYNQRLWQTRDQGPESVAHRPRDD